MTRHKESPVGEDGELTILSLDTLNQQTGIIIEEKPLRREQKRLKKSIVWLLILMGGAAAISRQGGLLTVLGVLQRDSTVPTAPTMLPTLMVLPTETATNTPVTPTLTPTETSVPPTLVVTPTEAGCVMLFGGEMDKKWNERIIGIEFADNQGEILPYLYQSGGLRLPGVKPDTMLRVYPAVTQTIFPNGSKRLTVDSTQSVPYEC